MTRNIFFDDPLFEEFALRPLIIDVCPLGEISTTTSLIEEGDRDGWYLQWTATAERVAGYTDESARAGHTLSASDGFYDAEGAGDHCEAKSRPLFHQRAFDWLDEALAAQVS